MVGALARPGRAAALAGAVALALAATGAPAREPTAPSPAALECLALAAYWEALAEGEEGMVAVIMVVLNRMRDPRFPAGACDVVFEGGEQPGCQFSFWCDGRSDEPGDAARWELAQGAVRTALARHARGDDPTRGALFFHAADIAEPWRVERERTARIGGHVFYR